MLTREKVIEVIGRAEDWKITQIMSTNATAEELLEAHTGVIEQGDLEAETGRRLSGVVAQLYEILMAGEPSWPESEEGA